MRLLLLGPLQCLSLHAAPPPLPRALPVIERRGLRELRQRVRAVLARGHRLHAPIGALQPPVHPVVRRCLQHGTESKSVPSCTVYVDLH